MTTEKVRLVQYDILSKLIQACYSYASDESRPVIFAMMKLAETKKEGVIPAEFMRVCKELKSERDTIREATEEIIIFLQDKRLEVRREED